MNIGEIWSDFYLQNITLLQTDKQQHDLNNLIRVERLNWAMKMLDYLDSRIHFDKYESLEKLVCKDE